jgi:hypothetical protein
LSKYTCVIPPPLPEESSTAEAEEEIPSNEELLKPMGASCLYRVLSIAMNVF